MFFFLFYFFIYSILLLWFGKYGFDRVRDSKDYFLGSGKMGVFLGVCTFSATWVSATSMLSLTGSIYIYGLTPSVYGVLGWFTGAFLLIYLAKRLKDYSLRTVPEYFYLRYDSKGLQLVGGVTIILTHLFYIMFQIRGFGLVISHMLEIPYYLSIFLVYLFIIYTTFGGFQSVVRTDTINFLLIFCGAVIAMVLIGSKLQANANSFNLSEILERADAYSSTSLSQPNQQPEPGYGLWTGLFLFFSWGLGKAIYPQYVNRLLASRDKKTASRTVIFSIGLLALVYLALIASSLGLRALTPEVDYRLLSTDEIMPVALLQSLEPEWAGIIMLAFLAAAISTANSQLLILSGSLSWDVYRTLRKEQISERQILSFSRWAISLGATIALLISLDPPDQLLIYSSYIWGLLVAVFFIPLYGGLFWKKATKEGAWASQISGFAVSAFVFFTFPQHTEWLNPALPGAVVSLIAFIVGSTLTHRKEWEHEKKSSIPIH